LDARVSGEQHDVTVRIGPDELRIRGVYETVSIVNDVMVALWFVVGGVQLLIRPLIRLTRRVHLGRIAPGSPAATARDF